ncbi:two-component system, chemotaxis family, CheB/CheR fusion protein [Daejeonella rubra]|uniref:histidine kinase n=1 Tax=Daejeonella rubra TaxID=990371 RepID=A0A1G9X2I8_9SPHI|nr:chemotaxis protein CheB [Daejeonella rubra]SDM90613.1 two-component system, chemotaxis family, CheB/CheR fusion protein [Daejeonella rubra]
MHSSVPNYIIAIGASAGGMDEINLFFDHTPLDGVAYVIIQHLSPNFKSRMVELLARHSKLIVLEAENEMKVICNKVYLIPHNKFMTISNGNLYLSDKENIKGPHLTINTFFDSLATDYGKKAIGIILSGLGSDGTEGIKAIKKAGGMVIARNPANSEFGSMPSSAIATGLVDFVLDPELMPTAIEDYVNHTEELLIGSHEDEKYLKAIIDLIKETSPLDFSDYKQTTILRRTKRRASHGNFKSLANYLSFLKKTPEEVAALAKEFLISVTTFFRDKEAFEFIEKEVFPDILKKLVPGEELKIWIAGCATGEEAYSMAILLHEQLTGKFEDTIVKIFATDIDSTALLHAGKGLYNATISKDISSERLQKYFIKEGDKYKVSQQIRKMVIFAQHDLVKNAPYCNMQFISCRNLLIYMAPLLQKKIFTMLLFGLKVDGYLFLGSSENPMPILKNLEVVNKKWKIYKNLKVKRGFNFDAFSLPNLLDIKHTPSHSVTAEIDKNINTALAEAMHTSLAKDLDYLTVCVNENNQVISFYGDTSTYLLQKHFTSNLTELLPKPLAIVYKTLSINTLKENKKVEVRGVKIKQGKKILKVNLSVSPLEVKDEHKLLMVIFTKDHSVDIKNDIEYDETIYLDQYTKSLETEVKELKDKLNSSYEKLDALNENMQSFNEELISANEEMQSTNEEMQSVNEELHTINSDYQLKNKELLEMNDDLNNYFRSNINGQLFINKNLELMKFSPGTVKQINLLGTDIGRPLSNISTNIKFETIIDDVKQVLKDGNIITKEIETNNGKWYQIMTMPYVEQATNNNIGAIITFNDITELKNKQFEIDKKNIILLRINTDLDHFIHAASHDLLAPLANIETSISIMNKITLTDAKLMDFLKVINNSVKKFRELITEIATIAKVESEMTAMEMVDFDDVIANIEWSLEDKIKASSAVITKNLEIRQIRFSKKNLRSILFNLISNAIKFNGGKAPEITIHTWKQGDNIVISVKDKGIGISKDDLDKIFNMYGRLNQSVEGHGIGLYLAKKIVNATGGEIIVESEPGKGSNFMIHLKTEAKNLA